MSKVLHRIEAQYILVFLLICLALFSIYSPSAVTGVSTHMGMLIGYLQAKTDLLVLFGSAIGHAVLAAYLSLRYNFGPPSTSHDGLYILFVNALYFFVLTTVAYLVLKRYAKSSQLKRILVSVACAGVLMLAVGTAVLVFNSKVLSQGLVGKPYVEYVVQPADTCEKIAFAYGVSTEGIAKWNGLPRSCDSIAIGSRLIIPLSKP